MRGYFIDLNFSLIAGLMCGMNRGLEHGLNHPGFFLDTSNRPKPLPTATPILYAVVREHLLG